MNKQIKIHWLHTFYTRCKKFMGKRDDEDEAKSPVLHFDVNTMFVDDSFNTSDDNVPTLKLIRVDGQRQSEGFSDYEGFRLSKVNSAIIVDGYDDIFSFYDKNKDYSNRLFSTDFLNECKRHLRPSDDLKSCEIVIALPKHRHDEQMDEIVRKRLKKEFKAQLDEYKSESIKTQLLGFIFAVIGLLMIAAYTYLSEIYVSMFGTWFYVFLECFDPIAWFAIWGGKNNEFVRLK